MDLVLSNHAIEMMASRKITWDQVRLTVTDPQVTYGSRGDQMFQRGDIAVVTTRPLSDGARLVKTVLLRNTKQWTDTDARNRTQPPAKQQSKQPLPATVPPVKAPAFTPAPTPVAPPRKGKHLTH